MKKLYLFIIVIWGLTFYHSLTAQITQLELMSGKNKTDFSYLSVKNLDNQGDFAVNNLAFFQKYHREADTPFDELGVQGTIFWNFHKNISIGPSLYFNSVAGFTERVSMLIKTQNKRFLINAISSLAHSEQTKSIHGELLVQFQYTKALYHNWSFVVNGLFLSNWERFDAHSRSFQQVRMGVSYHHTQFGIAVDFDQYGVKPITKNTLGFFIKKNFIEK